MGKMTELESWCQRQIKTRGPGNPVTHAELAALIGVKNRRIRHAVMRLVRVHWQPICSSYDPKNPGYYWASDPATVMEVSQRMLRHGVRIIQRARALVNASEDEVMGQIRMAMNEGDEDDE